MTIDNKFAISDPRQNNNKKKSDNAVGIEDKIFSLPFAILIMSGCWMPTTIKSLSLYLLYQFYIVLSLISIIILIVSVLLYNFLYRESPWNSLIEYWYVIMIWSTGTIKVLNILCRRNKIIKMLKNNILEDRWAILQDRDEFSILEISQKSEKYILSYIEINIIINSPLQNI